MPAHSTTVSVSMRPRVVSTARMTPRAMSKPVTSHQPSACAPAAQAARPIASVPRSALAMPSVGVCSPPRMRSGSIRPMCARTFLWRQQLGRQPERQRPPVAPVQLVPALGSGGDLDAPDGVEARHAVELEAGEQTDRLLREAGHRVRRVVLEDQSRRVRRRAAGLPQRALIENDDVAAPEQREMVGHAGAGDATADDDDAGVPRGGIIEVKGHGF
jgi:hypothetical protein